MFGVKQSLQVMYEDRITHDDVSARLGMDVPCHRGVVRFGGPTLDEAGASMNGTLLVIEAHSLPEVEAFVQDDPYVQAGLFASIQIRPWHWSLGNPELRG